MNSPNDRSPYPDTLVAICTYNERANIEEMVSRIFAAQPDCHLLVVDDCSPDGTSQWVAAAQQQESRLRLITRQARGLGGAIRAAMQFATDQPYHYLINLDADLSHDPALIPTMLSFIAAAPSIDVVVGSRYVPNGAIVGWAWHRRLMSRMINFFATRVLRLPVADCSGSFRCYRVQALTTLDPASLQSNSYAVLEEVLIRLHRQGAKMTEIPIEFSNRRNGISKLTFRESIRSLWQVVRLIGR